MENRIRVRVCFDCKVYVPIKSDNRVSINEESWFRSIHDLHRTTIIPLCDLIPKNARDPVYTHAIRGKNAFQ